MSISLNNIYHPKVWYEGNSIQQLFLSLKVDCFADRLSVIPTATKIKENVYLLSGSWTGNVT